MNATLRVECGMPLDDTAVSWLIRQGVPATETLSIRAARVIHDPHTGTYQPCAIGRFAFIIPEIVDDELVDLVAWSPATNRDPEEVSVRFDEASMLGEDLIGRDGLGTTGLPAPIFRDLIAWLRANRSGIVIVNWERAAVRLSGIIIEPRVRPGRIEAFARELGRRLVVAPPVIVMPHDSRMRSAA